MKKGNALLNEFKEFVLRGNVVSMAVGIIIGAAFQNIVTSFTDSFIQPIINSVGGVDIGGRVQIFHTGQYLEFGNFISAVINFLIMAIIVFAIVKAMNKVMSIGKAGKEAPAKDPVTKLCPYCLSEIPAAATRCPHCTSILNKEE